MALSRLGLERALLVTALESSYLIGVAVGNPGRLREACLELPWGCNLLREVACFHEATACREAACCLHVSLRFHGWRLRPEFGLSFVFVRLFRLRVVPYRGWLFWLVWLDSSTSAIACYLLGSGPKVYVVGPSIQASLRHAGHVPQRKCYYVHLHRSFVAATLQGRAVGLARERVICKYSGGGERYTDVSIYACRKPMLSPRPTAIYTTSGNSMFALYNKALFFGCRVYSGCLVWSRRRPVCECRRVARTRR